MSVSYWKAANQEQRRPRTRRAASARRCRPRGRGGPARPSSRRRWCATGGRAGRDQLRPDLLPGQRADPVHRPVQLQDAVAVEAVVEERDRAGDGARRPQRRRPVGGEVVLREAHVALRQRADLPVAPRQLGGPGHGVGAVGSLLRERVERAVGRAAAPHVLDHHDVAVVGEARGLDALRGLLAVGRADQQHRVAPGLRGAVDVGAQDDAVAGGHLDVELRLGHAVSLSGCAASRCRRSSSRRGGNPPA